MQLHQTGGSTPINGERLAAVLDGKPRETAEALTELVQLGLIERLEGGDWYCPELRDQLDMSSVRRVSGKKGSASKWSKRQILLKPSAMAKCSSSSASSSSDSEGKKSAEKEPKPHAPIGRLFQVAWAEYRHSFPVRADMPVDEIPKDKRYKLEAKDHIAAKALWEYVDGDMALVGARMQNMFESTVDWVDNHRSVALLWSHWSDFEKPIMARTLFVNGNGQHKER